MIIPTSLDSETVPLFLEVAAGRLEMWLNKSKILANRPENVQTIQATIKAPKRIPKKIGDKNLLHSQIYTNFRQTAK